MKRLCPPALCALVLLGILAGIVYAADWTETFGSQPADWSSTFSGVSWNWDTGGALYGAILAGTAYHESKEISIGSAGQVVYDAVNVAQASGTDTVVWWCVGESCDSIRTITGTIASWHTYTDTLTTFAGETGRLRWARTSPGLPGYGLAIDNVHYTDSPLPTPTPTITPTPTRTPTRTATPTSTRTAQPTPYFSDYTYSGGGYRASCGDRVNIMGTVMDVEVWTRHTGGVPYSVRWSTDSYGSWEGDEIYTNPDGIVHTTFSGPNYDPSIYIDGGFDLYPSSPCTDGGQILLVVVRCDGECLGPGGWVKVVPVGQNGAGVYYGSAYAQKSAFSGSYLDSGYITDWEGSDGWLSYVIPSNAYRVEFSCAGTVIGDYGTWGQLGSCGCVTPCQMNLSQAPGGSQLFVHSAAGWIGRLSWYTYGEATPTAVYPTATKPPTPGPGTPTWTATPTAGPIPTMMPAHTPVWVPTVPPATPYGSPTPWVKTTPGKLTMGGTGPKTDPPVLITTQKSCYPFYLRGWEGLFTGRNGWNWTICIDRLTVFRFLWWDLTPALDMLGYALLFSFLLAAVQNR